MRKGVFFAAITAAISVTAVSAQAVGVNYAYDAQGRVISATYENGTVITYAYDTAGNITSQQTTCPSSGC